tara:strand:+ start:300 stop:488 length:189 start_codon:yes stop_codon:yes gene_type:complete
MKFLIKQLLKQKNISQAELARQTGLSRAVLINYESFKTSPTLKNLQKIAGVLGVNVKDLFIE